MEWRAFELHPETPPEGRRLSAEVRARFGGRFERLRQQALTSGREMVAPEVIANSRRALEASEYARERGRHEAFHAAVFRRFYGEGQDIGRWDALRAAAEEVGLDPDEMQRATDAGRYRAAVDAQITEALTLGITGVPTFILDGRYAVVGAQPYEVFQPVMVQLAKDAASGAS